MLVTDKGKYLLAAESASIRKHDRACPGGLASYRETGRINPGRKKYSTKKKKLEAALHTYINAEINRMLKAEKPKVIYVPKTPAQKAESTKKINNSVSGRGDI